MAAVLSTRALNRALLARQGLLEPWRCGPLEVVERLVGLQAQAPLAPYFGVFSRLPSADPTVLSQALIGRKVVRLSLMRSTLQLVTAADALAFRSVLARRLITVLPKALRDSVDFDGVIALARKLIRDQPRTFADLGRLLSERFPSHRPDDLCRMARGGLALVQVPPRGVWGQSGPSRHALLTDWLDAELPEPDLSAFLRRYLTAFGPASPADITAWSGLTGVRPILDELDLVQFRTESGQTLYDVPDGLLPPTDTPAPVRILAEFDNILLGHADRSRIFADEHRARFMSVNGLISSTILVDGFVAGHCKVSTTADRVVATIQPYGRLSGGVRRELATEAGRLLHFAAPDKTGQITIQPV